MIDRAELLKAIDAMPFERGAWVVAGSAPVLMAGLIDSISDIDIVVDATAWRQAVAMAVRGPRVGLFGDHIIELEAGATPVEIFDGWLGATASEMIAEGVELEGFRFSPLSRVLDSKRQLARSKDRTHVELLESLLGEVPTGTGQQPRANSQQPGPD